MLKLKRKLWFPSGVREAPPGSADEQRSFADVCRPCVWPVSVFPSESSRGHLMLKLEEVREEWGQLSTRGGGGGRVLTSEPGPPQPSPLPRSRPTLGEESARASWQRVDAL